MKFVGKLTGVVTAGLGREVECNVGVAVGRIGCCMESEGVTVGKVAVGKACCMEGGIVGKVEGNLDGTMVGESDTKNVGERVDGSTEGTLLSKRDGDKVGARVDGLIDGVQVGEAVGGLDGVTEGEKLIVGVQVGFKLGAKEGETVGFAVGLGVTATVGTTVGLVGANVGALTGS